jgi:hypothetical protein
MAKERLFGLMGIGFRVIGSWAPRMDMALGKPKMAVPTKETGISICSMAKALTHIQPALTKDSLKISSKMAMD